MCNQKICLYLSSLIIVLVACKSTNHPIDKLPPMKIEIPEILKQNEEIVAFIRSSEYELNKLSENLEVLAAETRPYINKPSEDLSTIDKIKLASALGNFSIQFLQTSAKYHQIAEKSDHFLQTLSKDKAMAFEQVMKAFEGRINEINLKYKDLQNER